MSKLQFQVSPNSKFNLDSLNVVSHKLSTLSNLADQMLNHEELKTHTS